MLLRVRLTPRSAADRIDGASEDEAGRIVRAQPEKGLANAAPAAFPARALSVSKSAVALGRLRDIARKAGADRPRRG